MIKTFVSTIEQAQSEANALLTKGDWTEQSSSYCACGESLSVKVRDAETGKVRAIFAVCEACKDSNDLSKRIAKEVIKMVDEKEARENKKMKKAVRKAIERSVTLYESCNYELKKRNKQE